MDVKLTLLSMPVYTSDSPSNKYRDANLLEYEHLSNSNININVTRIWKEKRMQRNLYKPKHKELRQ